MWKPNADAIRRDMELAAAARARGEKWCWRCARLQEQGVGPLCEEHLAGPPVPKLTRKERNAARRRAIQEMKVVEQQAVLERIRARQAGGP